MKIAEIFGIEDGPLYEEMRRNILHINGADHARLRSLVNPALHAARGRALPPGDARLPRASCSTRRVGAATASRCEFVEAFAKPYPSLVIATVMGAPLEDAPRLHHWSNWIQRQFDAASMATERDADRARRSRSSTRTREALLARAARRPPRRPHLEADRGRGGRRAALRRRVHQPRAQRARRRRRHDPEPARARGAAARRAPRPVGAAARSDPSLARGGGRGGAALRADHAVHRADH